MQYTKQGQAYNTNVRFIRATTTTFSSLDTVEIQYGVGTRLYFSFLKMIAITNTILAVIGIVSWSIFLSSKFSTGAPFQWADFFTSAYGTQDRWNWWISGVLAFISWWWLGNFSSPAAQTEGPKAQPKITGPVYYVWERQKWRQQGEYLGDRETTREVDTVPTNYLLGVTFTFAYLMVCTAFLYGLIMAENYVIQAYGGETSLVTVENTAILTVATLMTLVTAAGFALCHTIWGVLSYTVTGWENNRTWFQFRMSQAIKLITFKILLATLMYLLIVIVVTSPPGAIDGPPSASGPSCNLDFAGVNFFIVILLDVALSFVVHTLFPRLKQAYEMCRQRQEVQKPEFNIANDLLDVLFRQFIIYIGFFSFPLIGLVGLLANGLGKNFYPLRGVFSGPQG